jgi:hypothetical protein
VWRAPIHQAVSHLLAGQTKGADRSAPPSYRITELLIYEIFSP